MERALKARIYMLDLVVHRSDGHPLVLVQWLTSKPDTKQLIDTVRNLLAQHGILANKVTARLVPVDIDIVIAEDEANR